MNPHNGQVVLVTGGSRGIGAATVRLAATRGHAVGFSYLQDAEAARTLQDELRQQGARVLAVQGDVAAPDFAKHFFDVVEAELGPVTALVNNAGITGRCGPFHELPTDIMRRTLEVNLFGALYLSQEAIRRWLGRGTPGRMVNISSSAATLGSPGEYVHYAASKAAIDAFTIGLGKEVAAAGIRINAVAPGTAWTGIHAAGGAPDRPSRVVDRVPMRRIAEPGEIAQSVLWLLSDEASYVTASIMRVAGGL